MEIFDELIWHACLYRISCAKLEEKMIRSVGKQIVEDYDPAFRFHTVGSDFWARQLISEL